MRVNALGFVMFVVVRAPLCFEEEHEEVKIRILRHQVVHQPNFDVFYGVGEGAVVPILTLRDFVRESMTKFSLILVLVVESLDSIMRPSAFVSFGAFFSVGKFAKFWRVQVVISPLVFDRVVVVAGLVVVGSTLPRALYPLEV
jgi:hypothetical protein